MGELIEQFKVWSKKININNKNLANAELYLTQSIFYSF
jgi:hypothetical protein